MDHNCDHTCTHSANKSVCQTLSEMDWERGIWNAGNDSYVHMILFFKDLLYLFFLLNKFNLQLLMVRKKEFKLSLIKLKI